MYTLCIKDNVFWNACNNRKYIIVCNPLLQLVWHVGSVTGRFLIILLVKFSLKRGSNCMVTFLIIWKHHFSSKNCSFHLFGNYWKTLGYLLFQHLVTLYAVKTKLLSSRTGAAYLEGLRRPCERFPPEHFLLF